MLARHELHCSSKSTSTFCIDSGTRHRNCPRVLDHRRHKAAPGRHPGAWAGITEFRAKLKSSPLPQALPRWASRRSRSPRAPSRCPSSPQYARAAARPLHPRPLANRAPARCWLRPLELHPVPALGGCAFATACYRLCGRLVYRLHPRSAAGYRSLLRLGLADPAPPPAPKSGNTLIHAPLSAVLWPGERTSYARMSPRGGGE